MLGDGKPDFIQFGYIFVYCNFMQAFKTFRINMKMISELTL